MNLVELTKIRAEREFKYYYKDKYTLIESAINDSLKILFEILKSPNKINFKSADSLEETINEFCQKMNSELRFRVCKKLRTNYTDFFKVVFEDFGLRTPSGARSFIDGVLSPYHISIVSPEYIDDDFDRNGNDISNFVDYKINLYGNLTITEEVKVSDICPGVKLQLNELTKSLSDSLYISLIRMNIGLIQPTTSKPEAIGLIAIDVHSDLIKKLTLEDLRTSVFKEEIFNIIFNKFILSIYTNMVYFSIVSSYDKFKNVFLNRTDSISYNDIYMSLVTNILSSNSVNCKYDPLLHDPELSLSALLDSIRLGFLHRSSFGIIHEGIHELRRFLVERNHNYPILLDELLDKFLDFYKYKAMGYSRDQNGLTYRTTDAFTIIPKNYSIESCENDTLYSNTILKDDKAPSLYSFYGTESLTREDSAYERLRRTKRMELLSKLSSSERNKIFKIENEIAKLRADSINCESPSIQKAIMKKLNIIAKDMNDMISKSNISDEFRDLVLLIENERSDIEITLSNRDFVKERKTMLYGQLATRNEYDY